MNANLSKYILVLLLFTAIIPAFAQIPVIKEYTRMDRDMEFVSSLLRMGDFERAISYLDQMKGNYGDSPKLDYMYKKAYALAKMYPEWEAMIMQQLGQLPDDGLLLAELGSIKFMQNEISAADSLWELALNLDGGNISVYLYVAGYKLQFGDYDGAVDTYRRGKLVLGSQSAFSYELAGVFESQRKYPEAIYELFLSLEQSPGRINTVKTKIRGFINDNETPDAIIDAVKKGVEMHPGKIDFLEILGDLYLVLGRLDDALETYKKMGKGLNDDGRSLCSFAERCLENRFYTTAIEAIDEYFRISRKQTDAEWALYIKGNAQRAGGFTREAIATLTSLAGTAQNRKIAEQSAYLLGILYSEDLDDCLTAIDVWGNLNGQGVIAEIRDMAVVEMASCYLKLDYFAAAESVLADLTANRGNQIISQKGMFLLADLNFARGELAKAKSIYEMIVKVYPGDYYANNALERLIILQDSGSDGDPDSVLSLFAYGLKSILRGNPLEGAKVFSDSVMAASSLAEHALYFAATLYCDNGERLTAINAFQRYMEEFPEGTYLDRAYFSLGDLYLQDKDTYPLAISAFNTILEKFPEGPVVEKARKKLRQIESTDRIG